MGSLARRATFVHAVAFVAPGKTLFAKSMPTVVIYSVVAPSYEQVIVTATLALVNGALLW